MTKPPPSAAVTPTAVTRACYRFGKDVTPWEP